MLFLTMNVKAFYGAPAPSRKVTVKRESIRCVPRALIWCPMPNLFSQIKLKTNHSCFKIAVVQYGNVKMLIYAFWNYWFSLMKIEHFVLVWLYFFHKFLPAATGVHNNQEGSRFLYE